MRRKVKEATLVETVTKYNHGSRTVKRWKITLECGHTKSRLYSLNKKTPVAMDCDKCVIEAERAQGLRG